MTIATTTNRVDVLGNGSAMIFSFSPVVIFQPTDLQVTLRDASGNETPLTLGAGSTNFSINVTSYPGTGSITYPASGGTPLASGSTIVIKRIVDLLQDVHLENQGGYFPSVQEGVYDKLTAIVQQQQEQIGRTVQLAATDPSVPLTLPSATARAGAVLAFDSEGDPIAGALPTGTVVISTAMAPLVEAASLSIGSTVLQYNSPVGGATRSVATKASDWDCILDFGALADGVTDNHAAFTNAGSCRSNPVIYVTAGTYYLSTAPVPTGQVTWLIQAGAIFTGPGVGANVPLPGMNLTMGSAIMPLGNAASPTYCYLGAMGNNVSTSKREFGLAGGVRSIYGSSDPTDANSHDDKVALYGGAQAGNGSWGIWGINTSTIIETGNLTNNGAWGYECDLNNHAQHYGNAVGTAGFTGPSSYGIQITGNCDYNNTYALGITMAAGAGKWNRGIAMAGNTINQSDIESYTQAARWAYVAGQYQYGYDSLNGAFAGASIRIGNGQQIVARNHAGTADITLIGADASNNIFVGNSATALISFASILPASDNSYNLGTSGYRFSAVWSATGTIQTSDPRLKTDIADLPHSLPIVMSLHPKTYKWRVGGSDIVDVEEEQDVHETETVEQDHHAVELQNGAAVRVTTKQSVEVPLYDDVPVVDAAGAPVLVEVPGRLAGISPKGVTKDAAGKYWAQETHRVPRTVKKTVTVKKPVERPGKRTHWGFMASDVRDTMAKTGLDFAGYVKGEDGTEHLRPDQLVPVLWKAVQELAGEVAMLKMLMDKK